jgi:hypothetical protein
MKSSDCFDERDWCEFSSSSDWRMDEFDIHPKINWTKEGWSEFDLLTKKIDQNYQQKSEGWSNNAGWVS